LTDIEKGGFRQFQRPARGEIGVAQGAVRHPPGGLARLDRRLGLVITIEGEYETDAKAEVTNIKPKLDCADAIWELKKMAGAF